jgi:hypothetical protein
VRDRNPRPLLFWTAIFVLMALLAGLALASATLPAEAPATPSPTVRPTAAPVAAPSGPVLSDTRGFVALAGKDIPAALRREADASPVASLRGQGFIGAVSGTGRRVAYWVTTPSGTRELRVFDANAPDQDTAMLTVLEGERGASAIWSVDRTGLLLVVESSARADQSSPFSALRVLDAPTRTVHEIARIVDGSQFWPVGWDRDSRLTGSCVVGSDGSAIAYAVIGEDAISARTPMDAGIPAATVRSSGTAVLGVMNAAVIRVWSIASYADHRELGANPGDRIAFARWRPGATEIVVSIADRLELWPAAGGDHRVVARGLPPASDLLVSEDGAIAVVSSDGGRAATAVDLASGRTAPIPMSGEQLLAAVSFR